MKLFLMLFRLCLIVFVLVTGVLPAAMDRVYASESSLSLNTGWNFVSFPKLPQDSNIEHMLPNDVIDNVVIIWGYDNAAKKWNRWMPANFASNTLTSFEIGKGYWFYLKTESSIGISAWSAPLSPVVVHLYGGWNLTGYHGTNGAPIEPSLGELDDKWSIIWNWQEGAWYAKPNPSLSYSASQPLDSFNRARAYWIRMNEEADWVQTAYGSEGSPISLCPSDAIELPKGNGGPLNVNNVTYCVKDGSYNYGFVNIHNGGKLIFEDATINFWTTSILVEASGNLIVGTETHPIGTNNPANVVTFHLYGDESQTTGIACQTTTGNTTTDKTCGVKNEVWSPSGWVKETDLPGGVTDKFYGYKKLPTTDVPPTMEPAISSDSKRWPSPMAAQSRCSGKKGQQGGMIPR